MFFLGKIEFLSPCPLAHFFFSILYNFYIFLSQLNRNKSGKVGRKPANPVKSRLCGCPLLFSKVGTKWASGQKISYRLPFSLKISWQFGYFYPQKTFCPLSSHSKVGRTLFIFQIALLVFVVSQVQQHLQEPLQSTGESTAVPKHMQQQLYAVQPPRQTGKR